MLSFLFLWILNQINIFKKFNLVNFSRYFLYRIASYDRKIVYFSCKLSSKNIKLKKYKNVFWRWKNIFNWDEILLLDQIYILLIWWENFFRTLYSPVMFSIKKTLNNIYFYFSKNHFIFLILSNSVITSSRDRPFFLIVITFVITGLICVPRVR